MGLKLTLQVFKINDVKNSDEKNNDVKNSDEIKNNSIGSCYNIYATG